MEKFEREFILTMDAATFEWLKSEMQNMERCATELLKYENRDSVDVGDIMDARRTKVGTSKVLAALDASSPIKVPVSK